jgi:Domain of unknown function (DUF222)/HNH endonuclease
MARLHPTSETAFARSAVRVHELEQLAPGPTLIAGLIELQGWPMGSAVAVRATVLWTKLVAHCEAQAMVTTAEAVTGADLSTVALPLDAVRIVGEELAALTHVPAGAAVERVALGEQIGRALPLTWEALDRGDITLRHATKFADAVTGCGDRLARLIDGRLIPLAIERGWSPQRLANEAAKALIALDPDGAADRADAAKQAADVHLHSNRNETASLVADGDAVTLTRIMAAIDARAQQVDADSVGQPIGLRRFNALAALVLGEEQLRRPQVETIVTLDLATWLGLNQRPGELSGFGSITADTARELAADSAIRRMLTDPLTGDVLDLGRRRYRPTAALRRFIRHRARTCQFPGCERDARRSDIDHIIKWDGNGPTRPDNLQVLCRRHHTLKTRRIWRIDHNPDGTQTWTTAVGFTHTRPAASTPAELLQPPDEPIPPEYVDNRLPEPGENGPPPMRADDPLPESPTITLEQYLSFSDDLERHAFHVANTSYDRWYRDNQDLSLAT